MGLEKCILVCIHHHGIQRILNALKILSSLPIHPSSPQINPWHPLMLLLSYSLAFSRRHIIGITEYVTFQIDFFHWHACSVGKSCPALCTPWIVDRQAPLSIGFPRQENCSRLSFLSPGDLPDPGIEPVSPASSCIDRWIFYH